MTRLLLVLVLVAASLAQPLWSPMLVVATPLEKKDQDLIQGTWKVVKHEHDGKVRTENFLGGTWVFKDNELTIVDGDKVRGKGTFVLDPDKKPKTIDIKGSDGQLLKEKTIVGIYKIEKDTLTLSQGIDERPKEFTDAGKVGKPGLLTLERVKSE
jgi:uncharacterized protein (TIGR03067 family)